MMARMSEATITVYGLRNCDTVNKARLWLEEQHLPYRFHDFKQLGIPGQRIDYWLAMAPWEKLLNRQGTTWRKLDADTRTVVTDAQSARVLMLANPSVVKRPVVEWDATPAPELSIGFEPPSWSARLAGMR